ncbi:pentatricopeptide repeat-containing protein At5g52850, chloroplastic [Humulus lupulus]|uniref:pentatricopeptide repeat-containing protein At5g52850, chloroplastic n=1 Tax=Humulus lupulus TaxID=3486 RepID=UPI002B403D4B|nr:pentatricopeptide repeat-containing protein At5g52850, chloroplastic [Humulus lupulus]
MCKVKDHQLFTALLKLKVNRLFNRNETHSFEERCLRIVSSCNSQSLEQGLCVHSPLIKLGLQGNMLLSNNLLSLYAKCFGSEQAHYLFDEMPYRDVVTWTGLLSAYSRSEKHGITLALFDSMITSGENPNEFTFSSVLRSCSALGEFDMGTRIHNYIVKLGLESNTVLLSSLIDFYSKCGYCEEAHNVFRNMDRGNTITWTTMISSFLQAQKWSLALKHYIDMINAQVPPNEFTFVKLLEASCYIGSYYGKLLHAHLITRRITLSLMLKTALVNMYSSSQRMKEAIKVLHLTPEYDVVLWTSVISGFTSDLKIKEVVSALQEMEIMGIKPNSFTYSNILKACATVLLLELGKQIHSRAFRAGLDANVSVGNALVEMYMKCSNLVEDGFRVFSGITSPDVISWTSLIAGFADHGFERDSFQFFLEMQAMGVEPNSYTLVVLLHACRTNKSLSQTLKLHGYIIKAKAFSDIVVGNALVDTYAALGMVNDSWQVTKRLKHRDIVTYTNLVVQMNKLGNHEMVLNVIKHMKDDNIEMDGFSLSSFLSASAALAAIKTGKQLHCYSIKSGFSSCTSVSNGLVDLYWKCGYAKDGHRAFTEISDPDVVSWNGLISGLASNGYINSALSAFDDMRLAGLEPDSITFLSVLFACSRGGLVDLGLDYFHSMRNKHCITPQLSHYVCLVDLLGRAGQLEDAMEVIENMPFKPDPLIYKTLLGSCKLHGNLTLAEDMARRGLELDPSDPVFYMLLANLYDESGRSNLGKKTRQLMEDRGVRKNPGQCWIENRNKVHIFNAGDRSHPQITEIHDKILSLTKELKRRGYSFKDAESSSYHSEKLALVFGLLNTPSKAAIHISKDIRICSECHDFIMQLTRFIDRDVIFRDGNRIHAFKRGKCSCRACYEHSFQEKKTQ